MSKFTIVNNSFLPAGEASVLITDLAVQRGYGIFDFFKTINSKPVFIDDHLDRFYNSAAAMHLPVHKSRDELKALIAELISRNETADSGIRITLTGGYSADGYAIGDPNMIITQQPLLIDKEVNKNGISLITHNHQRQLPQVKTLDYLMAVWLQPKIKQNTADDVLYYHNNIVTECPRANFFIVTGDNGVLTTRNNVLPGITRKHILQICKAGDIIDGRDITFDDLKTCKEAFISSSTKNVMPVTAIDGRVIGNGTAGPITLGIAEKLRLQIAQY